jgi:hypothetical protein
MAKSWERWRTPPPAGGSAIAVASLEEIEGELAALYAERVECGTVPLPFPDRIRWMAQGIEGRRLAVLSFRVQGRLRGWSLLRLDVTCPAREALVVELFAPVDEAALYPWMVAETLILASTAGCLRIIARTACPNLKLALRRGLFRQGSTIPIHVRPTQASLPPGPFHLGLHTSDFPLRPYPGADASWGRVRP